MTVLTLMVGVAGSGKSTAAAALKETNHFTEIVSRDAIRFSKVKEDEEYFSKEDEVFNDFCCDIAMHLILGHDVIADATHLNAKSRAKVIDTVKNKINLALGDNYYFADHIELQALVVLASLETCLKQNENREGRARVPRGVIRRQFMSLEMPILEEGFSKIIIQEE